MSKLAHRKAAQSKFSLHPLIAERWSPRAYNDEPVSDEELGSLFEAARWAASSSNEQPWAFIVARKGEAHYDKLFESLVEGNQRWAHTAPVLVATLARKNLQKREGVNQHAWHDLGLAMGNLSLQATHLGLQVHQMGGIIPEKLQAAYGIDPNEYDVVTLFTVGYHDLEALEQIDPRYEKSERASRERKALSEQVFGAHFGESPDWLKE